MKRLLRWIGIGLGSLAGLVIVAYAVVYVLSDRVLQHVYAIPAVAISIPTDPASITRGGGWRPFAAATAAATGRRPTEWSCLTNR